MGVNYLDIAMNCMWDDSSNLYNNYVQGYQVSTLFLIRNAMHMHRFKGIMFEVMNFLVTKCLIIILYAYLHVWYLIISSTDSLDCMVVK